MIYFRFQVAPLSAGLPNPDDTRTADFFFDLGDPALCTRKAAALLAAKGWRPTGVVEAQEAFSFRDLEAEKSLEPFFDDAEREGVSFRLNADLPARAHDGLALTTDLGTEVASFVAHFPLPQT